MLRPRPDRVARRWRRLCWGSALLLALLAPTGRSQEADAPVAAPPAQVQSPPPAAARAAGGPFQKAVVIELKGEIHGFLLDSFTRRLKRAREEKPDLLIVEIDSPGGMLDVSETLAHMLRDVDWAHTVAYIPDHAISGGAMIALGCDEIVMRPDARIGNVGVIWFGGQLAEQKIVSEVASFLRALAEAKNRPPAIVEAMTVKDLVVYPVRHKRTGVRTFMSDKEIESSLVPGDWVKGPPVLETQEDRFLTVTGRRAVELDLASATVSGFPGLRERFQLQQQPLVLPHTWVETTVYILNSPLVTGLLLVVGLIGLYIEFSMPGVGVGGLIGGLCFAIYFWSHWMGGTAGLLELILFGAGIIFLAVEFFVLPGFGIAGITGGLLLIVGLLMASQHVVIPRTSYDLAMLRNSLLTLTCSGVAFLVIAGTLRRRLGSTRLFGRLVLTPPGEGPDEELATAREVNDESVSEGDTVYGGGDAGLVGKQGRALTALRPAGKADIEGRYVDVVAADGEFIDAGREVRVIQAHGNVIIVHEV